MKNKIVRELSILGKSQGWLSKTSGVSRFHLNKIISNKHEPKLKTAMRISGALGKRVEDLWSLQ